MIWLIRVANPISALPRFGGAQLALSFGSPARIFLQVEATMQV